MLSTEKPTIGTLNVCSKIIRTPNLLCFIAVNRGYLPIWNFCRIEPLKVGSLKSPLFLRSRAPVIDR